MRLILADLWRQRLWLLVPGLVAFGVTGFAPNIELASVIWPLLGTLCLSFEFARGVARPTLLQPVTSREIARAW